MDLRHRQRNPSLVDLLLALQRADGSPARRVQPQQPPLLPPVAAASPPLLPLVLGSPKSVKRKVRPSPRRRVRRTGPTRTRVFVSFDYDHDFLAAWSFIGQANCKASPFFFANWMLKEAAPERDWLRKAVHQIKQSHVVLVICGEYTHRAPGVIKEVFAARLLGKPVIQIRARSGTSVRPVLRYEPLHDRDWLTLMRVVPRVRTPAPRVPHRRLRRVTRLV